MAGVTQLESDRLSTFRTRHNFRRFGEFKTLEEFIEYRRWAKLNGVPLYILGNGSNTLFTRRNVHTLVLQNSLKPSMIDLGDGRIEATSSMQIMPIMRHCEKQGLNSFYFLASVPATVGGALAMNAGGGSGPTIYDFVESVTFVEGEELRMLSNNEIQRGHRQTMFTGIHDRLIVKAVFKFPQMTLEQSSIRKRIDWALSHQDLKVPNCGSVFKECSRPIIARLRGLPPFGINIPLFWAQFSRKVNNWIICRNPSSWPIVFLIRTVQAVHRIVGKRAVLEIIEVQ